MIRFADLSIRWKILLIIVVANSLGLLVAGAVLFEGDQERQHALLEARLGTLATAVGINSAASIAFSDVENAQRTLSAFASDPSVLAAGIYTPSGLLAGYGREGVDTLDILAGPAAADPHRPSYAFGRIGLQRPVTLDGEQIGRVVVAADISELAASRRRFAALLLGLLALSLAAVIVAGWRLQRAVTVPLTRLTEAVRGVGEGRSVDLVPPGGADELGILARSFNTMVENLRRTTVSRNYLDNILSSMFDALVVVAPDGRIRSVNRSACDLLGYAEDELVGRPYRDILELREQGPEGARALHEEGAEDRHYIAKDGTRIPVSLSRSALLAGDELDGTVCVAQDMTTRRQQEAVIHDQNAKLAVASRMSALGEMAAGVAHEINNPLAILLGRAGQLRLLARRDRLDRDAVVEIAGKIEETVKRGSRIVNGMRLFARDAAHEEPAVVELARLIEDTLEMCRERFRYHGVALALDLPQDEILLQCRVTQMGQVLLNLLNNAYDAVEETAEKEIRVRARAEDGHLRLEVSNSGPPVPEEIRDKIFQPFFSTKGVGKGTGLGLSISKGIVESHGGTLVLHSPARPVTFQVRVPLGPPGPERDPGPVGAGGEALLRGAAGARGAGLP